jgi:hypothetical protein
MAGKPSDFIKSDPYKRSGVYKGLATDLDEAMKAYEAKVAAEKEAAFMRLSTGTWKVAATMPPPADAGIMGPVAVPSGWVPITGAITFSDALSALPGLDLERDKEKLAKAMCDASNHANTIHEAYRPCQEHLDYAEKVINLFNGIEPGEAVTE